MKGQAAIMDAFIFMLICSGAATLLLFVSSLYASSTNGQILTIYNYEYAGNALIALHYAKDSDGRWFWNELKTKLIGGDPAVITNYFEGGPASYVWKNIIESSPAGPDSTFLCFEGAVLPDSCYPFDKEADVALEKSTVHTSSVKISRSIIVILKLYY